MITIREMKSYDIPQVEQLNNISLPENYNHKYYSYHLFSWPGMSFVAEDLAKNKLVGYVLSKIDEENVTEGHITSIGVNWRYKRAGIASKLMSQCLMAMKEFYELKNCFLNVRMSNKNALALYRDKFNFTVKMIDKKYYQDGEDGYLMEKAL
ncbi:MAG: N-terminal acetyltransferase A complex catalytic subunit ard1 [Marteilia pararefringens]